MYNKKTLTFTFHHYWEAFCPGGFCPVPDIYTEGKKKCRVNILSDLILFIRRFFSILIYKDKNTNLINKFF